jgi:hypothetical protein
LRKETRTQIVSRIFRIHRFISLYSHYCIVHTNKSFYLRYPEILTYNLRSVFNIPY